MVFFLLLNLNKEFQNKAVSPRLVIASGIQFAVPSLHSHFFFFFYAQYIEYVFMQKYNHLVMNEDFWRHHIILCFRKL